MTQLPPFLTPNDVARRYDTTPDTIRRWVREGKLPVVRMPSGRMKFRRIDIDALMPEEPAFVPTTTERHAS